MDPRTFPTKGNLMLAKNSLSLARQGYDLMDKKRNILKEKTACKMRKPHQRIRPSFQEYLRGQSKGTFEREQISNACR